MSNQIELSASEMELININRQKAELEKQERLAKRQIANDKKIQQGQSRVASLIAYAAKQNAAATEFFNKIEAKYPGLYELDKVKNNEEIIEYNWYHESDVDRPEGLVNNKEIIFSEIVNTEAFRIKRTDNIYIIIKEHLVSTGGFYERNKNQGFKMFVLGTEYSQERKPLINVDTAHRNIQDFIDTELAKNRSKNLSDIGWDMLNAEVKREHPDAIEIKKEDKYISTGFRNTHKGFYKRIVIAIFANGLEVSYNYRYFEKDNEMVFIKELYNLNTSKMDQAAVVTALKGL